MSATSPFAQAIAAQNDAVVGLLANADVTVGGVAVAALFHAPFYGSGIGDMGAASASPRLTLRTSDLPDDVIHWSGDVYQQFDPSAFAVTVNAAKYRIVAHEPNGSGLSRVILEATA